MPAGDENRPFIGEVGRAAGGRSGQVLATATPFSMCNSRALS